MKRASTLFLKLVLILIGAIVTISCAMLFPEIWRVVLREMPEFKLLAYLALGGFFFTLAPFLFALFQAFRILNFIDRNNAFSVASLEALRYIKYSAIAMSIGYAAALPLVMVIAELDDAPGAGAMGLAITGAPLIVATFAAVLQKLIQSALDLKQENDLTV